MTQSISLLTLPLALTGAVLAERAVTVAGAYPSAAATCLGITRTGGAIGETIPVDLHGTAVCTAGAAITAGAELQVGTDGKLITRTTGIGVGIALQGAAADGSRFEALLRIGGTPAAA